MATGKNRKNGKQTKDVSALVKVFFTLGVLTILLFIGMFVYAKLNNTPRAVVDEYLDGFLAKSPSRVFRTLGLKQSLFVTPDKLDALLKEMAEYDKITSYSLEKLDENDSFCHYRIEYMNGRVKNPFSQALTLKQSDEDYLLFFNKWVIDSSELMATGVTFRVPLGAKLRVDGFLLTDEQLRKKSETDQVYDPGDMFIGKHTYEVEMDGFEPGKSTVTLKPKNYGEEPVIDVTMNDLKPDAAGQEAAKNLVSKAVQNLYESMLQRRTYDFFLQEVAVEEESKERFRARYDAMVKNHINTRTHLMHVTFGDFISRVKEETSTDGNYAVRVDTNVPYTSTATVVVTEDEKPELKNREGTLNIRSVLHYHDGQWWLSDSDMFRTFVTYAKE